MAKGKLYIEKRKHKRVDKKYEINYMLVPKELTSQIKRALGISRDISMGGIRVEGEILGTQGDVIKAEINTADNHLIVFAEIKWIKKDEKQFGLSFLSLKADDEEIIEGMVDED
jgi:hypothetical protein